ncbi:hypothetical protein H5410_000595 [Solanum commersonii]|uniref:Leucine-rich repeat-containing N-terminal plant-type domain-containing protein n=1 Tax=Solanum commersonii TaxID=4109 RepID=A0A9J6AWH1_SOLCO|nr:hypothetical protein H5410_000595 [Solanum commersonii]
MGYVNLVFFMLFPFLCHLSFSSSLPHLCPKHQALPLLQFKHMFTVSHDAFDNCFDATGQWILSYPKTLSWNKSTDCCSWDGVYCDETTGQVIELNLTCSKLQGKFHSNSSVFQLSNLKRLDLSNNNFSGSLISPKFGEFSSLTQLDLSYSSFTGIIPAEISRLSKLHVFRIQSYSDGLRFKPHNFELLLKNLTQLRELDFDNVNISSTIPLNFSSYLTTLHLRNTQLYGTLPEGVFHLYNLESLYLTDNPQLTVRFPTTKWNSSASLMELVLRGVNATGRIPESFGHLTSLHTLRIASCNLLGSIPKPLLNLTNIEEFNLAYNHLEGPISDFFRFGKLRWLSLRYNNFDGQLEFLSFNRIWTQLEELDCSVNSVTGPIPSNVSGMQNLQSLRLSSNHLNGTIPSWIFSLPSLTGLELSDNHFSGNIQEFKSKTLSRVSLKQNQLQGPIPKSLLDLQRRGRFINDQLAGGSHGLWLWTCYWTVHNIHNVVNSTSSMVFEDGCKIGTQNCYENEKAQEKTLVCNLEDSSLLHRWDKLLFDYCIGIRDQWIQSYPKILSWNKSTDCCSWGGVHCDEMTGQVIELNLNCSKLQGKFHSNSSLFQLSNLKRLDLSYNDFSSLTHLDLLLTSFTGLIPAEISHLSKLRVLRIWNDYGVRFGPNKFALLLKKLTQLRELDLNFVDISSTFPLNFSSYLTTLWLPYTQLRGILPKRVFNLSNLGSLDLTNSPRHTVRFPTKKWNTSASLTELYLNGVNFTGKIPESFSHLTLLLDLVMSSSNLSVPILKPLWNLTNIEVLDLHNNHLEGPISPFLRFAKLREFSLRKNNFDGQFEYFPFNRSWTQLETLDFSFNFLPGPIPSDVSGLQNLQSLSLSSNQLNGTIPSWIFSLPSLFDFRLE